MKGHADGPLRLCHQCSAGQGRNVKEVCEAHDISRSWLYELIARYRQGAAIGYSIVPSSSLNAKGNAVSAQLAGVKVGYLNSQLPFGSTNVGPGVIAVKNGGVDSLVASVEQSTSLALITGLRTAGALLVAPMLTAGYGSLLPRGPPLSPPPRAPTSPTASSRSN